MPMKRGMRRRVVCMLPIKQAHIYYPDRSPYNRASFFIRHGYHAGKTLSALLLAGLRQRGCNFPMKPAQTGCENNILVRLCPQ